MPQAPPLFDCAARHRARIRAVRTGMAEAVAPVWTMLTELLLERLDDTTRRFPNALVLGGRGIAERLLAARGIAAIACELDPHLIGADARPGFVADFERLPLAPASLALVIAPLSLHWIEDLPGTLIQLRRALQPDGLLLASLPLAGTLGALREALAEAENALCGGVSPRVAPLPELRDCAALLQRAGFALPVADRDEMVLRYANPAMLLTDLRAAGETNTLAARSRRVPPRALFAKALASLPRESDGRVPVRLQVAMLTGWAPSPAQPRPAARGSGQVSLTQVFATQAPQEHGTAKDDPPA